MTPVQVINGADHPELIPDATAYRLFLVMLGLNVSATGQDLARQAAHARKLGLSDADRTLLIAAANDFKIKYEGAINTYNVQADATQAGGQVPNVSSILAQREALVEATCAKLTSTLSAAGLAQFNSYIQSEKRRMSITRPVASN
jgi:hypothetical protein